MKKRIISGIFFLIIFFISVSQAQNLSEEKEKKLDEIGAIMEKLTIEGDYKKLLSYYTDDVIIMPDFASTIRGYEALKEQYEKDKEEGPIYHSFTGTVEKRWIYGNEIYERGTFGMAVSSGKSPNPKAYYGSYFQIWQEYPDGSFKIKYIIWNLDFNPCF